MSGVIDSRGNLIASIDLNEVRKIVVNSPKFINESFFNKFGNKIYFLIILLYTMSFFLFKKTYE